MFCKKCGTEIADGSDFCPNCGAAQNDPVVAAPAASDATAKGRTLMILGIVAMALAELGIPGIIVGAIALSKAKAFIAEFGSVFGMAKVGRILGKVGLILGIVMTVLYALSFVLTVILLIMAEAGDIAFYAAI